MKICDRWLAPSNQAAFATAAAFMLLHALATALWAQNVGLATPFQSDGSSYYENVGLGWSFNRGNFSFDWGGGNAIPPFGGYDPNADARLGLGFNGPGGGRFGLNLAMGQGSSTTRSSTTPSLTIPNGGMGFINNTLNQPFVTSVVPVVGSSPLSQIPPETLRTLNEQRPARLQQMRQERARQSQARFDAQRRGDKGTRGGSIASSSAQFGDISIAEIRAQQKIEDDRQEAERQQLIRKARSFEESGKLELARYYYRVALRKRPGDSEPELQAAYERVERLIRESTRSEVARPAADIPPTAP